LVASLYTVVFASKTAAASWDRWEYYSEIPVTQTGWTFVPLPSEVLENSKYDLTDLRVVNMEGDLIPSSLSISDFSRLMAEVPAEVSVETGNEEDYIIIESSQSNVRHNRIEIFTESRDFLQLVILEARHGRRAWKKIFKGYVFDHRGTYPFSKLSFDYPEAEAEKIRVKLPHLKNAVSLDPLNAKLFYQPNRSEFENEWPVNVVSKEEIRNVDREEKVTQLILDLGKDRLPSSRIVIESSEKDFYWLVNISAKYTENENFGSVGSGKVWKRKDAQSESLSVSYPEVRTRFLKIEIRGLERKPVIVGRVRVFGNLRKLIFKADKEGIHWLYYGREKADSLEEAEDQQSEDISIAINLGPLILNPEFILDAVI